MESTFLRELEEDYVVRSTEDTFEVRAGRVYVSFRDFCVFIHLDVRCEAVAYMLLWERNPSAVSLKTPSDSAVYLGSNASKDRCP